MNLKKKQKIKKKNKERRAYMNQYADYDFYKNEYKGTLSEELFNSYIGKASKDIERNVNIRLNEDVFEKLKDDVQEKISYVACELCDYQYNFGSNADIGAPNSFSIDGVNVTQGNYSSSTANSTTIKLKNIYEDLPQELTRYL
jgi:hypothetical protein